MKNRFPSVEAIESRIEVSHPMNIYPAMTGALSSMYGIATAEFDHLRRLAAASLDCGEWAQQELRAYLDMQEGIAELYEKEDTFAD